MKKAFQKIWKNSVFNNIFCNVTSGVILMFAGLLFIKNDNVKQVVHELITPDVISYSREIQEKAATEIESGMCPALTEFVTDYGVMRDETRFLKKQKPRD